MPQVRLQVSNENCDDGGFEFIVITSTHPPADWNLSPEEGCQEGKMSSLVTLDELWHATGFSPNKSKVSQKAPPLNVRIDRLGSQRPSDGQEFQIQAQPAANPLPVQESFAPAQFFDPTDEEKLTSASFKQFDSGVRIGDPERLRTGYAAAREVKYELKYIDSQREQRLGGPRDLFEVDVAAFNTLTLQGAIAQSERAIVCTESEIESGAGNGASFAGAVRDCEHWRSETVR